MEFQVGKKVKFVYAHDMWPMVLCKLVGEIGEIVDAHEFEETVGSKTRHVVLWIVDFGGLKVWMRGKYLEVVDD